MPPAGFNTAILQFKETNFPNIVSKVLTYTRTITQLPRVLTEKVPVTTWQPITELG